MIKNIENLVRVCLILLSLTSIDGKLCREVANTTNNCDELFQLVIHCNSDFVTHSMQLSNPFKVCTDQATFESYRLGQQFYQQLFTSHDAHDKSLLCSDKFLNKNQMNLITTFLSTSQRLWESANCDDCYADASPVHNYSRNTEELIESHAVYSECVQNITAGSLNMSLVCIECDSKYATLNKLYDRIKKSSGDKICFDLQDKMNKTRRDWSSLYNCCKGKRDSLTAFYSLAAAIIIIAISFYCTVYCIGIKYPETETLDERDVTRTNPPSDPEQSGSSTAARPSSSSASASRPVRQSNKLSINADDSDDDQILSGSLNNAPLGQNLITLGDN